MNTSNEQHEFKEPLKRFTKKDDNADAIAVGAIITIAVVAVCVYLYIM